MTRELNRENGGARNVASWVFGQLLMTSLALVWVWLAGLRFLWRSRRPELRALVWAYGLLYLVFAVTTGGKIYYLAGAYVYLLAAGAVAVDGWLAAGAWRWRTLLAALAVTTTAIIPTALPVLPPADLGWSSSVNQVPPSRLAGRSSSPRSPASGTACRRRPGRRR
jgi:hypothetical protein